MVQENNKRVKLKRDEQKNAGKHGIIALPAYKLFYLTSIVSIYYITINNVSNLKNRVVILFVYTIVVFTLLKHYKAFLLGLRRIFDLVFAQSASLILIDSGFFLLIKAMTDGKPTFRLTVCLLSVQIIFSLAWSFFGNKLYLKIIPALRTIVIKRDTDTDLDFLFNYSKQLNVIKTLKISEITDNISVLLSAEAVFIPNIESNQRNNIVKYCTEHSIEVIARPKIGDILLRNNAVISETSEYPVFYYENNGGKIEYRIIKRSMDIVLSLLALVPALPVMGLIAILIKRDDGGPVLYKQLRLTKDSKPFKILKFRSMRVDAEKHSGAILAAEDDDRITKVGKFLRRYRLDELAQLFNILVGDMTIVGPRPERPEIIEQYIEELPEFNMRLMAKAGLTGYAQVFGRYNTDPYEKLQMDLIYIANISLYEDLRIMFYTVRTLFSKDATQGMVANDKRNLNAA